MGAQAVSRADDAEAVALRDKGADQDGEALDVPDEDAVLLLDGIPDDVRVAAAVNDELILAELDRDAEAMLDEVDDGVTDGSALADEELLDDCKAD